MRPEFSLIFLTTLSGVGQGLLIVMVLLESYLLGLGSTLDKTVVIVAAAFSLLFPGLGAVASFFHLGKPERGWKAMLRWKSSWLSREVLSLPAFMGCNVLFFAGLLYDAPRGFVLLIGYAGVLAAILLYLSSAMLYAAITFILEWATPLTVFNYITFGITTGAALAYPIFFVTGGNPEVHSLLAFSLVLLGLLSLILKSITFSRNNNLYNPAGMRSALRVNDENIVQMETGCAYETYNTHDYYFENSIEENSQRQRSVILITFLIPLLCWLGIYFMPGIAIGLPLAVLGCVMVINGMFLERRHFFIQANHVQNLYYGNFRPRSVKNPLLTANRPGFPRSPLAK